MDVSSVRKKIFVYEGDSRTMLPLWASFANFAHNAVRGVSGSTTAQCVARLAGYSWAVRPTIAIIEIGINDTVFDVNQAATIANIKTIVGYYQTKCDRVYVCSSYPFNISMYMSGPFGGNTWATVPYLTGANNYVENVSNAIKAWCESEPNTQFVDLRLKSSPSGELLPAYTYDGVHGSSLMNQLIIDAVLQYENIYSLLA